MSNTRPKKRILFVRPTLGTGGADRVTAQLLKLIDRNKYSPELALMQARGPFLEDVPEDVPVHDCKARSLWWMVRPLSRIIALGNYDLIYSTCSGANIPVGFTRGSLKASAQIILSERNTMHRPDRGLIKGPFLNALKRKAFKRANWITAVSQEVRQQLIDDFYADPEHTVVVNNPLVDDHLHQQSLERVDHPFFERSTPVILAAGRFVAAKNFSSLLDAYTQIQNQADVRLCLLGDGPLLEDCKDKAARLGITEKVWFAGFDKNPYKYMSKCDVFVLSSLHEGMPGVLVQALACGAPCVSTDCPTGPKELIADGENGFLVPVGDQQAMTDRILQLLSDPLLSQKFREAGPKSVERFETDRAIDSYFAFLDE